MKLVVGYLKIGSPHLPTRILINFIQRPKLGSCTIQNVSTTLTLSSPCSSNSFHCGNSGQNSTFISTSGVEVRSLLLLGFRSWINQQWIIPLHYLFTLTVCIRSLFSHKWVTIPGFPVSITGTQHLLRCTNQEPVSDP